MKESALVTKIRKAVQAAYPSAYIVKLADRSRRGLPDLLIIYNRTFSEGMVEVITLFVEVKTETGRLSAIQKEEHNRIRSAGADVIVATSPDAVLREMKSMRAL